jgi:hypothetical protein
MGRNMDDLDCWRVCEDLSVREAALLFAGVDPAGENGAYCEDWRPHQRPRGYEAAKSGIASALRRGAIRGHFVPLYDTDLNGSPSDEIPGTVDLNVSRVEVDSLREWLFGRGIRTGFFFPEKSDAPDYLDPNHPRYSAKLAAAVKLWQAMDDENLLRGKAPTVAMREWLESRYRELGLTWDGGMNNQGIADVVKVANWKVTGGATATPGE